MTTYLTQRNSTQDFQCNPNKPCGITKSFPSRTLIHPKLELTELGDSDEQEADAAANEVMSGKVCRKISGGGAGGGMAVSSQMESQLNHLQGGGQTLPAGLRGMMERGFDRDFSQVRLHTDSEAAGLSSSIHAKAFTHGNDIYFNRGQFSPETSEGQRLVAHELAHVAQGGGKVGRDVFVHNDNFAKDKGLLSIEIEKIDHDCFLAVENDLVVLSFSTRKEPKALYQELLSEMLKNDFVNNKDIKIKMKEYVDKFIALRRSYLIFDKSLDYLRKNPVSDIMDDAPASANAHFIFAHGYEFGLTYNGVNYTSNSSNKNIPSTEDFKEKIVLQYKIKPGDYIFLISCSTGSNVEKGFAKSLSKIMDNVIIAPMKPIGYDLTVKVGEKDPAGIAIFYHGEYCTSGVNSIIKGKSEIISQSKEMVEMDKLSKEIKK